jgi:hypothetical protein
MSTITQPAESERLAVNAADAAKLLGISERHLWAMHATGRLGPHRPSPKSSYTWKRSRGLAGTTTAGRETTATDGT